jgi:hypothetical protein
MDQVNNKDFWPVPFWAVDQQVWSRYVGSLKGEERRALDLYTFRLEVLRQALPDYEVIAIDASFLANDGGAINCSSKEIPAVSQVRDG